VLTSMSISATSSFIVVVLFITIISFVLQRNWAFQE
jgi:hypothetical protein